MDCLICFKSHPSSDCPERKPEHCAECHAFIVHSTDHSSVCGSKTWSYSKYVNLYASQPKERCILGFSVPFRFLTNGNWRKGNDGLELCSSQSGAFFRFKGESDLSLLSTSYAPVRIIVIVKDKVGENEVFREKLLLLTSPQRLMVATDLDRPFDGAISPHSTLVLAVGATNLAIDITVFPPASPVRSHHLLYDGTRFVIPDDINVMTSIAPTDATNVLRTSNALVLRSDTGNVAAFCGACYGVHRSNECNQRILEKCPECHVPVTCFGDHAPQCHIKTWYVSDPVGMYIKLLASRCVIAMQSSMHVQLGDNIEKARAGLVLVSPMSDTYFKFVSHSQVTLLTTGFTRIRIPIIIHEVSQGGHEIWTEKLVLLSSHDRTMVAAKGSRQVSQRNVLNGFEHNTPLIIHVINSENPSVAITLYSAGQTLTHEIPYNRRDKKYTVPSQINITSQQFVPMEFDAPTPKRKK